MLTPDNRSRLIDHIGNPGVVRSVAAHHVAGLQSCGLKAPLEATSSRLWTTPPNALSQSPAWIAWSPLMFRLIRITSRKARSLISGQYAMPAANFVKNPARRQATASADILKPLPNPASDAGLGGKAKERVISLGIVDQWPDGRRLAAERRAAGTDKSRDRRRDGTTHPTADRSEPERAPRADRNCFHSG